MEIRGDVAFPFDVVCGTSAGAINAVFLAANAQRPREGVDALVRAWRAIVPSDVYDPGWLAVLGNLGRISMTALRGGGRGAPAALLDSTPLRRTLGNWLDLESARRNLAEGHLGTLCVTAMDYGDGSSVAFYEGGAAAIWNHRQRRGSATRLELAHVMASSAIPVLFPAERIGDSFFGDGALRQLHPLSPALKFGARRLFVVGVSARSAEDPSLRERRRPGIAQMAGHLLNREFIDNLEADLDLAGRFNTLADALEARELERLGMKRVETLVISPSVPFNEIAAAYMREQPATMRFLFRLIGATPRGAGASFASYLMFDGRFCARLMELGYRDAIRDRERISAFLGVGAGNAALTPAPSAP
jgi:NTE family protein